MEKAVRGEKEGVLAHRSIGVMVRERNHPHQPINSMAQIGWTATKRACYRRNNLKD